MAGRERIVPPCSATKPKRTPPEGAHPKPLTAAPPTRAPSRKAVAGASAEPRRYTSAGIARQSVSQFDMQPEAVSRAMVVGSISRALELPRRVRSGRSEPASLLQP
eukprot:6361442-Prymnesium_polylepis.2